MTEARWGWTALLLVLLYQRQIRDSRPLFRQNGNAAGSNAVWTGEMIHKPGQ